MKITWVLLFVRSIARQHPTEPAKAKAGDTTHAATAHRTAPAAADPEVLGRFLVELADASHKHQPRVDEYKGHRIAIETHYEITVDGTPVPVHLTVGNDGDVHCHALPAYEFVSAVDMVHVLIDTYPDDFPAVPGPAGGTRDRRGGTALGWRGAEMAVVRRNILTNPDVRHAYVHGVLLLKQQETSFLTSAYNIPGTAVPVRAYDLFVIWHHKTMKTPVPPDGDSGTRNAAHRGPVFLPWHRLMLRFMELNLQRVLEDPTFGLPTGTGPSMGPQPPMVRLLHQRPH